MQRAALALSILFAPGCAGELDDDPNEPGSSDEVFVEWDSSTDFTAYSTYAFVEPEEGAPETVELNVTRVRNAVRHEYELLGLVEAEDAELDIMILTETEDSSSLELDCVPAIYWYGTTGGYNSCALLDLDVNNVTVGTILLGIGDAARGETIFNGVMQGVANGQDVEIRIERAVGRVFDDYPADQTGV